MLGFLIGLAIRQQVSGTPPPSTPWILATGAWNDSGAWSDAALWKDS